MAEAPATRSDDRPDSDDFSTSEMIAEARRPLLIARHKELIEEMESGLSDAFIADETDNPRLEAIFKEYENPAEQERVRRTIKALADDVHYRDRDLRSALIEELALLRENGSIEVAVLQHLVIGVYRTVRKQIIERQRAPCVLVELRALPASIVGRLLTPLTPEFGTPRLSDALVYTPVIGERTQTIAKRLRRALAGDDRWKEASGDPPLAREVEAPIEKLSETERITARSFAVQQAIRSAFYRQVFLQYFDVNELDPREVEAYPTILAWLEAIEDTPHLFPFMQGQTQAQKIFRLGQLVQKLLQLHEIYARLEHANENSALREQFTGKPVRERLQAMAKAHYPPLPLSNDMMVAVLRCPFTAFVAWVQKLVGDKDFVLPPDPRK